MCRYVSLSYWTKNTKKQMGVLIKARCPSDPFFIQRYYKSIVPNPLIIYSLLFRSSQKTHYVIQWALLQ